ncbi:MAG: hypothetical protein FDZ69_12835 [Deltaproteobacteria bacterium]|nr:MAG: hypothetical protein FDZ69_12835 [Deltaproteobacteria bacterium]
MRCPKCGFHSFDHLDSCKICHADLTGLKSRLGHRYAPAQAAPAAAPLAAASAAASAAAGPGEPEPAPIPVPDAEDDEIDFGFDDAGDETARPGTAAESTVELDDAAGGLADERSPDFDRPFDFDFDDSQAFDFGEPPPAGDLPDLDEFS